MRGTETYYFKGADYNLARAIHRRMLGEVRLEDNGVRRARFFVLNHTTMPSVCIEPAYMSNVADESLIKNQEFQKKIAAAVVSGLGDYFKLRVAQW